jgi:hypothetical protein
MFFKPDLTLPHACFQLSDHPQGDLGSVPESSMRARRFVLHHFAVMRIGGELRGGGSILDRGLKTIVKSGSPPPRIVIGRPYLHGPPKLSCCYLIPFSPFSMYPVMTQDAGQCRPAFRQL